MSNIRSTLLGLVLLLAAMSLSLSVGAATLHVNRNHPRAADTNPGSADRPLITISRGADLANPGDTVMIWAGVYREHVSPKRGGAGPGKMITYQARPGDAVVIKGSDLWRPNWRPAKLDGVSARVWQAPLNESLFAYDFPTKDFNPFHQSPLRIYQKTVDEYYAPVRPAAPGKLLEVTRGAIFFNGKPIKQITDPAAFNFASGVFMVPEDGKTILLRLPFDQSPRGREFEIVTREQVFAPKEMDLNFIRLKGLIFEHAANGNGVPQFGMVSVTRGMYWIIEDCAFRWAGTAGADIGQSAWYDMPGRGAASSPSAGKLDFDMIVRRCTFADNGTAGLWCYSHGRSILVEDCVFERNNWLGRLTWEEAGLKCHGVTGSVFRNNLFRDNDSYALWLDVCGGDNRITQNLFINNMNSGVFIEAVQEATLVDNNISIFCRPFTYPQLTKADGFYNHQSSNVIFAHNLAFGNTGFGVRCLLHGEYVTNISGGLPSKVSHNRVLNNIVYANGRGAVSLPVDQRLCWDNTSEGNFIWGAADAPLFELERGIMPPSQLVGMIEKAIGDKGISPHEAPLLNRWKTGELGPNVGDMRHNGPLVGLPLWRAVQQRDMDSVIGPLPDFRMYFDGKIMLQLKKPSEPYGVGQGHGESDEVVGARPESYAALTDVKCAPLPYIKYDYFGNPRPTDQPPTVGPIQDLPRMSTGEEASAIELWPNANPNRPLATAMKISIKPLPVKADGE